MNEESEYSGGGGRSIRILRREPELLTGLPRLIARLPANYPNKRELDLERQLYQVKGGYAGERKVDRFLESFGINKTSTVFTDIHLSFNPGHSFQIDTLILSPRYVLLLEVKNIKGNLYFESNPHQLRREYDGEETIMECPLTQLEVAREHLFRGFEQKGLPVNLQGQVILANRNAVVKQAPQNSPILFLKRLAIVLREMENRPIIFDSEKLKKITRVIRQHQVNYHPYPLCEYFDINPRNLKLGQLCSKCNESLIYITKRKRYCRSCHMTEPNNPSESLQDWFMLINSSISNRQCRYFLGLKNKDDAYYAIKSMVLNKKGKSTATKYYWPEGKPFRVKN